MWLLIMFPSSFHGRRSRKPPTCILHIDGHACAECAVVCSKCFNLGLYMQRKTKTPVYRSCFRTVFYGSVPVGIHHHLLV